MDQGTLVTIFFTVFSALIILGAIGVVALRNIFHSALSMSLCLLAIAGYFVLLNAEFLAAVQVIIYVGAIMVLIIFAILLSQRIMRRDITQTNAYVIPVAISAASFLGVSAWVIIRTGWVSIGQRPFIPAWFGLVSQKLDNTQVVGWSLMSTYTLPFVIVSILLLMVLVGSVLLTHFKEDSDG